LDLRLVLQLVDEMDELMGALPVGEMDEIKVALMAVHWVL
jgi:hypothetical protein